MNWILLISAIAIVESGGNPQAFNRSENAVGLLQIRPMVVADVNQLFGSGWTHEDAWDPQKANALFVAYTRGWCLRKNISVTPENCARIWNGGPDMRPADRLDVYWGKVRTEMLRLQRETSDAEASL